MGLIFCEPLIHDAASNTVILVIGMHPSGPRVMVCTFILVKEFAWDQLHRYVEMVEP